MPEHEPTSAEHAAAMQAYGQEGARRAERFGNRGPVRLDADGRLHPDIVAAYREHGFYVFEGVVGATELEDLRHDAATMLARAPVGPGADVDALGRPALGLGSGREVYVFVEPLSDPSGGTAASGGRYPTRMTEPIPDAGAPRYVVQAMRAMCQHMPAGLRLYGHPRLLGIAASINGDDFVPYNDVTLIKQPGLGGSVAWHQDGVTHWDDPRWDQDIHGFNFQVQLYPTTAANALWVVPGTHRQGRVDIARLVADAGGTDRVPEAIPLVCAAGDVTMVNRQTLHGSFANTSPDVRVSVTFGFHRRTSVLGAKASLAMASQGVVYDERRIRERSAVVAVAIDARRRDHPDEPPFRYAPFSDPDDALRYDEASVEAVLHDYNLKDLAI